MHLTDRYVGLKMKACGLYIRLYRHVTTQTSFLNSGWPYIPLEEGSQCALLPVGLRYILLALGLSLSFRFCAFVDIEVCFR
jgi:hypothetical protein